MQTSGAWECVNAAPPLRRREAHVWRCDVAGATGDAEVLSASELRRAAAFTFDRDRARFVARRSFLRGVLSWYTGVPPRDLSMDVVGNGKPVLTSGRPFFSLSHTAGVAYLAISADDVVGVDAERAREIDDVLSVAETVLTPSELQSLLQHAPDFRSEAFLRAWTRKEAVAKALGIGITSDFCTIHVGLDAAESTVAGLPAEPSTLWVSSLRTDAEHVALATATKSQRILRMQFSHRAKD